MRYWKRLLGLGKLPIVAAMMLASCSHDDKPYVEEFVHTGYCAQWDGGWGYIPHPDVYPEFFHQVSDAGNIKLRDNIIEIVVHDNCSGTQQDATECPKCNEYNDHSIFTDPRRVHKIKFDLHTADTVLFKKFFFPADCSLDLTMNQWAKIVPQKQTKDKQFYLHYKRSDMEHHIHKDTDRLIRPEDIISVYREIER